MVNELLRDIRSKLDRRDCQDAEVSSFSSYLLSPRSPSFTDTSGGPSSDSSFDEIKYITKALKRQVSGPSPSEGSRKRKFDRPLSTDEDCRPAKRLKATENPESFGVDLSPERQALNNLTKAVRTLPRISLPGGLPT